MLFEYETDRLVLRILKPEKASMVLDFYNRDRELFEKYETDRVPNFYTVAHHQQILRFEYNEAVRQKIFRYYVFKKGNPMEIIGTICLHHITGNCYNSAEIGYKFSGEHHHRGYAYEAIRSVLEMAFATLELNRITALVCEGNDPSMRLLEKFGFTKEGICREFLNLHGQLKDHHLYSILARDKIG